MFFSLPVEVLQFNKIIGALLISIATMLNTTGDTAAAIMITRIVHNKKMK